MSDRGQALVEFALALPLLLVVAFGVVELSELGVARLALAHAAAEGARIGALTNEDSAIRDTVAAAAAPLAPGAVDVSIVPKGTEPPRTGDPRGSLLRVELSYAMPVPLAFLGMPRFVVRGSAARRIEWTP